MSRRRKRRGGGIFGGILILAMVGLLFWNEGRSVSRLDTLADGRDRVVEADAEAPNRQLNGELVHLTGSAEPQGQLTDSAFGLTVTALRLDREVEMFQWDEVRRGSGESARYELRRIWSHRVIYSSEFRESSAQNPSTMIYAGGSQYAQTRLGRYALSTALLGGMAGDEPLPIATLDSLPLVTSGQFRRSGDWLYTGDPSGPEIGDHRVRFTVIQPQTVSVLARQSPGTDYPTLEPFVTEAGGTIAMIEPGVLSAAALFALAEERNAALTWGIRVGGTLGMAIGWSLALGTLARMVPVFGGLARGLARLAAVVLAVTLSALVIAAGWFAYRPVTSLVVIGGAALTIIVLTRILARQGRASPSASQMAQPNYAPVSPPPFLDQPPPPPPPEGRL